MKLENIQKKYTLKKEELEKLVGIKISSIYVASHTLNPSYDLTILTEESK